MHCLDVLGALSGALLDDGTNISALAITLPHVRLHVFF